MAHSDIRTEFPTATAPPSATPIAPCPGIASNEAAFSKETPATMAAPTMAAASGCSDQLSSMAATRSTSSSVVAEVAGHTRTTDGFPAVMVPVLSKTTVVTPAARSSAAPPLMRIPSSAPRPVATITAVGTANPMAQGHAMTSTATAAERARTRPSLPTTAYHVPKVMSAISSTVGTKIALMRSASRWMGARVACASRIISTMRANVESAPTVVARISNAPDRFTVPPVT